MPQGFPCAGLKSKNVASNVAGEGKPRRRGQYTRGRRSLAELMGPLNLASLVVNGLKHALAPQVIICARPTVGAIGGFCEIKAIAGVRRDDKQSRLRVKNRGGKVSHPVFVW